MNRIIIGDALESLKQVSDEAVDCCVTSPPYYGLRDYGVSGQIGLEETPDKYIDRLVEVFREVRRTLKRDGTLWVVIADSYARPLWANTQNITGGKHMAKKNCRMTEAERAIHDRAVSIRKMTDQQICEFVDRQYSNGMDEGIKVAKQDAKATKNEAESITKFIDYLTGKVGTGNGIGNGAIYRLRKELQAAIADGIIGGTA